jgi:hypothetical protein
MTQHDPDLEPWVWREQRGSSTYGFPSRPAQEDPAGGHGEADDPDDEHRRREQLRAFVEACRQWRARNPGTSFADAFEHWRRSRRPPGDAGGEAPR